MDKEEYENIWMSRKYSRTYSSSESSLEYVICHASQDESTQKQPWSEGMEALSNLPGGDIALSLIPTLHGDALQKVLEEFQCVTFNKNEDRKHSISLSTSADEIEQKTILVDENRAAAVTPVQLLAEWPDTCLLIASWLNHVEIVKALLEKIVPVSTSDNDGRTPLHLPASTTSTKIEEKQLKHGNFEGSLCCGSSESRLDTRNSAQDCKNKRSDIMSEGEYENISLSRIIHPRTCSSSESRLDTRNRVQDTDCKNKRSDIMSEEEYENIWFNRIVHPRTCSSSEGNLESVICHASQDESTQKQPWSEEMKALSNLPGGDRALSLIPTLHGDALQKVQEKFQCATSDKNEDQHISLLISDDLCERDFLNKDTSGYGIDTIDYVPTVKYFIKSRADMENARKSALYYAVLNNAVYCVEALLQAGACPNNSQVHTATPLHVAATLGNVHCIKLLLDHNADVTIEMGTTKLTPLLLTAEKGNAECTKLLLVAGASTETRNSSGQTAMHLATLAQSVETIKELIRFGAKVDEEDNEGRIPLHAAVARTLRSSEIVKILIQAGASINKADKFGYTPLHIAALNENSHSVMILLSKGGDVTARTKGGVTALSFIIRRTPNVFSRFVTHLNQAISLHNGELGDVDCELRLDFSSLLSGSRSEMDLMLCLVEVGRGDLLKHALCESFLHLKWKRIRKFFLFSLLFHLIFLAFFTGFVCATYLWDEKQLSGVLFWPVLTITCLFASKEIFQITYGIYYYTKRWENWLQWSVIVASSIILIPPWSRPWQYHVAAVGILLAWIELMIVIGYFPMFGLYVQMFKRVSISFFKFLAVYFCLLIGFSLSFNVLHKNYKSFTNPLISMLKIVIMMSGELEFEDIFFNKDDKCKDVPLEYPGTAHVIFLCFIIMVTVILMNLILGLAVSDIQKLRSRASFERLVRHTEVIAHFENMLFSKLLDYTHVCKIIETWKKNTLLLHSLHDCTLHIRPNDPGENRLPRKLIQAINGLASERKTTNDFPWRATTPKRRMNHMRLSRMYKQREQSTATDRTRSRAKETLI